MSEKTNNKPEDDFKDPETDVKALAKAKAEKEQAAKIKAAQNGSDCLPKEKERDLYHVILEKPFHDNATGKKLSPPAYTSKFSIPDFHQFERFAKSLGFTVVTVIWNPEFYKDPELAKAAKK